MIVDGMGWVDGGLGLAETRHTTQAWHRGTNLLDGVMDRRVKVFVGKEEPRPCASCAPCVLYLDVCSEGKSKMSASTGLANTKHDNAKPNNTSGETPGAAGAGADGVHGPFFVPTIQA